MTKEELAKIQSTFPWREEIYHANGIGGVVRMVNRDGHEVSIFTMTAFLQMITTKMAERGMQ